jgi:hypothetical protein
VERLVLVRKLMERLELERLELEWLELERQQLVGWVMAWSELGLIDSGRGR